MTSVEPVDTGGTIYDDPNRECVGLDPAWVEGTGGPVAEPNAAEADQGSGDELDQMTKDQLLEYAQLRGISPANASMSKDDLKASIRAAES
jgi:hypothetical protein